MTGTVHLLALAVNHYLNIAYPFEYGSIMNARTASLLIAALWFVPLSAMLLFSLSLPGQMLRSKDCMKMDLYHTSEYRYTITAFIAIVFIVSCTLYAICIYKLRAMRRQMGKSIFIFFKSYTKTSNSDVDYSLQSMHANPALENFLLDRILMEF